MPESRRRAWRSRGRCVFFLPCVTSIHKFPLRPPRRFAPPVWPTVRRRLAFDGSKVRRHLLEAPVSTSLQGELFAFALRAARTLNRSPDLRRRERHIELRDAERTQRVDRRIRERR